MENLKGIRKLYRKGNGQGKSYRAKLNSWSYYELQRQIEYKARWEGIPVSYVSARGTTTDCSICGSRTYPIGHRVLHCSNCRRDFDRDENAARNILRKGGARFTPNGSPGEAQGTMQEPEGSETAILTVDEEKLIAEALSDVP